MKRLIIIITIIITLFVGIIFLSNHQPDDSGSTKANVADIVDQKSTTVTDNIISTNGQLIDVREPEEYEASHADNAINIPLGNILNSDYSRIDTSRPIYLYCRSGNRAGQAKIALEQAGYKNVTNLGGLDDWVEQSGKICSTSKPSC
jgi:phage shock protein E